MYNNLMDWLQQYNIYTQGIIVATIMVVLLTLTVWILHTFKVKVSRVKLRYVYAFSSGFLIVTAIVGQWVTARHQLSNHWTTLNKTATNDGDANWWQTILSMIIIFGGILVGTLIAYRIKKMSTHSHDEDQREAHKGHGHKESRAHNHIFNSPVEVVHESKTHKSKSAIVYMVLTHRLPAGLIMGILLVNFNNGGEFSFAALLAFILHIIPELIIIYYARLENGDTRIQALIFSIGVKLLLIPFIFLGIVISNYIDMSSNYTFWIMPMLLSIAGIVMIWGSIFELGPVFIHTEDDKNAYKLIFVFIIGLSLSMAIQLIHVH